MCNSKNPVQHHSILKQKIVMIQKSPRSEETKMFMHGLSIVYYVLLSFFHLLGNFLHQCQPIHILLWAYPDTHGPWHPEPTSLSVASSRMRILGFTVQKLQGQVQKRVAGTKAGVGVLLSEPLLFLNFTCMNLNIPPQFALWPFSFPLPLFSLPPLPSPFPPHWEECSSALAEAVWWKR